jgi:transposase, IS30 family
MHTTYTHLTQESRYTISTELKSGKQQTCIAGDLGIHRSTLWRERKRNKNPDTGNYNPVQAHNRAQGRRKAKPELNPNDKCCPSTTARSITAFGKAYITQLIREKWSPEQIKGALTARGWTHVPSHEWIYQFIYSKQGQALDLKKHLRCQKTYRKRGYKALDRRGRLNKGATIHERPAIIETRSRIGDLEGDTIIGKNHKGAALTLVDRKSLYVWIQPMEHRYAITTAHKCIKALADFKPYSITFDNGKEFAAHALMAQKTGADIYFADAYQSNQRARNENTNGLIRQYLPKSRRLDTVSQYLTDKVAEKLNNRPRKTLNWLTPSQVLAGITRVALRS